MVVVTKQQPSRIDTPDLQVIIPDCPMTVYRPSPGQEGVVFPEAFPNSVRHWLLIGALVSCRTRLPWPCAVFKLPTVGIARRSLVAALV